MGLSLGERSWRHLRVRSLRKIFYDVDFLRKRNKKFEGGGTLNQLCASSYNLFESLLFFLLTNHLTGLIWVTLTVVTKLGYINLKFYLQFVKGVVRCKETTNKTSLISNVFVIFFKLPELFGKAYVKIMVTNGPVLDYGLCYTSLNTTLHLLQFLLVLSFLSQPHTQIKKKAFKDWKHWSTETLWDH